jgi:hypothetical protein
VTKEGKMRKHLTPPFALLSGARPSPATVLASVALLVALGGTATAQGVSLPLIGSQQVEDNSLRSRDVRNNTLRSRDVRNNTLRSRDVRNNTLRGRDVRDRSLTRRDFRGSLRGPAGPAGPRGETGAQGPIGVANLTQVTALDTDGEVTASCPDGMLVVSGGGFTPGPTPPNHVLGTLPAEGNTGWTVAAGTPDGGGAGVQVFATALCSPDVTITPAP